MTNLIRCKACGYVTREGRIKDVCPACGVPAKMFEPYTDPVSEKRRLILNLHAHPVIVHFPQAFTITLLMLMILAHFSSVEIRWMCLDAVWVIASLLPYFVMFSFLTGLVDGKIRFRKVTTPFLKTKIVAGLFLLIISVALSLLAFLVQLETSPLYEWFTLLTVLAVICSIVLGFIGGRLTEAKFPG